MKFKSIFIRIIPDEEKIQNLKSLRILKNFLQDPEIFHLTRHSAAGGVSTGLFIAFLPVPGHTILAAIMSILFRINLPLCVIFAWTTNPVTFAPAFYLAYETGAYLLGRPLQVIDFEMTWSWFGSRFLEIWPSLLTGSLIFSIITSVSGYLLVRLIWKIAIIHKWRNRNENS